jgi:glycosyltransferase involved in cell wall biosynthesis
MLLSNQKCLYNVVFFEKANIDFNTVQKLMNKNPLFSVVIATYNRANMIGDTIRSILRQSVTDFELIVVDDGSKDETVDVIGKWTDQDARVRYIYQENMERGAARNNGFKNARGNYVVFFDSDDEMLPNHLQTLRNAITRNPQYELFATKYAYNNGRAIVPSAMTKFKEGSYDIRFVLKGNPIGTLFCVRREAEGWSLFPEDRDLAIMEDWVCLVSNMKQKLLYLIDDITIHVNDHEARSMAQNALVIRRRIKATEKIIAQTVLNSQERKTIWAYTYYFCGIHNYLDHRRKQSLDYFWKAVKMGGLRKDFVVAAVKSIVGKKTINKINQRK